MKRHLLRVNNQFNIECDDYIIIYKNDNSDKTFLGSTADTETMIKMVAPLFDIVKGLVENENNKTN